MACATLDTPVRDLHGVGPERASQLARLHLRTAQDLLEHRPRRHEDRRHAVRIADLTTGQPATVRGRVVALGVKYFRKRTKSVFELILEDGSARLHCRWWNLPFMQNYFRHGDDVFVHGKPIQLKPRTIDHPECEVMEPGEESSIHLNRITPIYALTEGLPQRWLRSLIWRVVQERTPAIAEPHPDLALHRRQYPTRAQAFRMIHFPESIEEIEQGRARLALDECVELQLELQNRRRQFNRRAQALPCAGHNRLMKPFLASLGFQLTAAQTRVLRALRRDLSGSHPMRRLVQGDVGAGKTVVAACAALMALESGFSVLLMAPTEILAEQHLRTFRRWFDPLAIPVEIRTGSRRSIAASSEPKPTLVIGTHALIEDAFALPNLGLVIIDEQHKFGVAQRERLVRKGRYPHLLVMTATPIPRTLGLTLYGDLDVSVIDELPRGRAPLKTLVRASTVLPKVFEFVRRQLEQGRQAYLVYPRVEESDTAGQLKAVTREFHNLQRALAPHTVALLHGRLHAEEKDRIMEGFRAGQIQALVATAVVEVGLDVPNATVMVVENADRFGLAQLHQLRGRIGRGPLPSYCILVADQKTEEARQRLEMMAQTNDGFRIAEADLQLRGPGDFLGQDQSGLPPFRFADLTCDVNLLEQARTLASSLTPRS